ncbi:hypothetical protein [Vibrio sp. WXL103]|uniref:hypothetical protein n=1 Tax=Vibrio sp. WXL103 TaxID=3450710 RepID=UPI003EC93372
MNCSCFFNNKVFHTVLLIPLLFSFSWATSLSESDVNKWNTLVDLHQTSPDDLIGQRELLVEMEQHHAASALMLGGMLVNGEGGEVDSQRGLELLELAAQLGNAYGAYYAFVGHTQSWSVHSNPELAAPYLWLAASESIHDSHDHMVRGYLFGLYGLPRSPEAARSWAYAHSSDVSDSQLLELCTYFDSFLMDRGCIELTVADAAEAGDAVANYRMGYVAKYGFGREHDALSIVAEEYLEAAVDGYPYAISALYALYTDPLDREFYDPEYALDILRDSLNSDNPFALDLLGQWHTEFGEHDVAIDLFQQAEAEGVCSAKCLFELAMQDKEENLESKLAQAASLGSNLAQYQLALRLWTEEIPVERSTINKKQRVQKGITLPPDVLQDHDERAEKLWLDAAWGAPQLNPEHAKIRRGDCSFPSEHPLQLMHQAALGGVVEASLLLERYYRQHNDTACANVWLRESAALGHSLSQIQVGELYWRADTQNPLQSYWYERADSKLKTYFGADVPVTSFNETRNGLMPEQIKKSTPPPSKSGGRSEEDRIVRFEDGGLSLPDRLIPPFVSRVKLTTNNAHLWPTHCGYLVERATGELLFLGDVNKGQCFPAESERQQMEQIGVKGLVSNIGASAALLRDGSVVAWGAHHWGGTLIQSNLSKFEDERYASLDEEMAVYNALRGDVIQLAASQESIFALKSDGTVISFNRELDQSNQLEGKYQMISAQADTPLLTLLSVDGELSYYNESIPSERTPYAQEQSQVTMPANGLRTALTIDAKGQMREVEFELSKRRRENNAQTTELIQGTWARFGQRYLYSRYYTIAETVDGKIYQFIEPITEKNKNKASDIYSRWEIEELTQDTQGIEWF